MNGFAKFANFIHDLSNLKKYNLHYKLTIRNYDWAQILQDLQCSACNTLWYRLVRYNYATPQVQFPTVLYRTRSIPAKNNN